MSLSQIEYPTLDTLRTAVVMTHGTSVQERVGANGETVFFKIDGTDMHIVAVWSVSKNYGVVYN